MSINRFVSIQNAILNAYDFLGVDRAKNMPAHMTWAIQAENAIGGCNFVKEKKILDICGCTATLPCNAVYLQAAILGAQDCSCNDLRELSPAFLSTQSGGGSVYDNNFLVIDLPSNTNGSVYNQVNYEIQGNKMVFYENLDGQNVTVQYLGQPLDENGFPKVSENHIRAITEFVLWQYCRASKYSSNPLPDSMAIEHKREWFRLCSNARALDATPNPSEQEDIAQMLSYPLSGRGLHVGMTLVNWNVVW